MDFDIEDIDRPQAVMAKHVMQPRALTDYEQALLKALMAQPAPVTAFALVAWHLDKDATPEDAIAGIEVVEMLFYNGYLCMDGDYVALDSEQKASLTMRVGEMSPVYQAILKILYEHDRPLRPSELPFLAAGTDIYKLLKEADAHHTWNTVSAAYCLGIQLSRLKELGYVCKSHGYYLNSAQRVALKHRFPAWGKKPQVPQGDANPAALATRQHVRQGRAVELD